MFNLTQLNKIAKDKIELSVLGQYQNGIAKPLTKVPFDNAEVVILFLKNRRKIKTERRGNGPEVLKALESARKSLSKYFKNFDLEKIRKELDQDLSKHFRELDFK